ncbi:MAG: hypothetical protein LUD77_07110 [Clostridiales bacterium]|nr:hypothetical protein [Clostridiales bacterium]
MKFWLFIFTVFIFTALTYTELDKEDVFEFERENYTTAGVYVDMGEEKEVFAGFYPEELRGLGSDVYIRFMKNTDELPEDFIILCSRDSVSPYLIIEGNKDVFNTNRIKKLAENLGFYDTKAYIELYPIYAEPSYNKISYKQFYKKAAEIFKKYAPKTEIVWAISSDCVYGEGEWLPYGADIDYMGVSVILGLNGENNSPHMWDKFEYLSRTYDYPLVITRFSITDYSEKNTAIIKTKKKIILRKGLKIYLLFTPI